VLSKRRIAQTESSGCKAMSAAMKELADTVRVRAIYFVGQGFSVKIFFLSFITLCYFSTGQPFDWVYVAILCLTLTLREGKELLEIWNLGRK